MEPTSLTAAAIATLVATKAFEKTGEKITEGVWKLAENFLKALQRKDKGSATAIEKVAQNPDLTVQQPNEYGLDVLTSRVEEAMREDKEIQLAAQAIQTAIQAQPGATVKAILLAEKIGVVNNGPVTNQTNNFTL